MGKDLYEGSPAAKTIFDKADDTLGFSLSRICFDGPEEELKQTKNTQPAIFFTQHCSFPSNKYCTI